VAKLIGLGLGIGLGLALGLGSGLALSAVCGKLSPPGNLSLSHRHRGIFPLPLTSWRLDVLKNTTVKAPRQPCAGSDGSAQIGASDFVAAVTDTAPV